VIYLLSGIISYDKFVVLSFVLLAFQKHKLSVQEAWQRYWRRWW